MSSHPRWGKQSPWSHQGWGLPPFPLDFQRCMKGVLWTKKWMLCYWKPGSALASPHELLRGGSHHLAAAAQSQVPRGTRGCCALWPSSPNSHPRPHPRPPALTGFYSGSQAYPSKPAPRPPPMDGHPSAGSSPTLKTCPDCLLLQRVSCRL